VNAVDLIAEIADWKLFLVVIFVYGIFPQWILRALVHVWPKDDPRRTELLGELYEVPRIQRPFWVAEQLEAALADGLVARLRAADPDLKTRIFIRLRLWSGYREIRRNPRELRGFRGIDRHVHLAVGQVVGVTIGPIGRDYTVIPVEITQAGRNRLVGRFARVPDHVLPQWAKQIRFARKYVVGIEHENDHGHAEAA
jgi:hypothetical protein